MRLSANGLILILTLTFAVGFLVAPLAAEAPGGGKIARIGVLVPGAVAPEAAPTPSRCLQGFWQGLEELGYREGHNLHLAYRYVQDPLDRLPALVADLVRWQPDLIFTVSNPLATAAKQATNVVPIVVGAANEFVESGLVMSLAHPGGNLTGLELRDIEFLGKRLELLKAALPEVARVAVLVPPDSPVEDVSKVLISDQRGRPNSYRLMKSPSTRSCMRSVFEKQIVRRTKRLIRVRRLMCLLSIFCVLAFPTSCSAASRCRS
jgi:putative tryptophan/tyrosine transport system substrate-binding protein